jgi:hypothetical protein
MFYWKIYLLPNLTTGIIDGVKDDQLTVNALYHYLERK